MKKRGSFRFAHVLGAALLVLAVALPVAAQPRIVAVGDIHGAYTEFTGLLEQLKLLDSQRQWAGGETILVQLGDVPDRGPATRQCLDLLMELERQARREKGRVVALLGNHEVMTMIGDLRYVSAADYQSFATAQSAERREREYRDYRKFLAGHDPARHPNIPPDDDASRTKWMTEHPLGFFERRDAFGPRGVYGRWVRKHPAMAKVGDGLFVHGGLNPAIEPLDIGALNRRVREEIAAFDTLWEALVAKRVVWKYMTWAEATVWVQEEWAEIQARGQVEDPEAARDMLRLLEMPRWLINSPDGPLWYRGLALEPEENLKAPLESALNRLGVRYLVAGHTVRPKFDITPRFDHRVFLIDTGMLKETYGGRASALEILNGKFTAYYLGEKPQELPAPGTKSPTAEEADKN